MTEFEQKVFAIVKKIPSGQVLTYQAIAVKLGKKGLARAVGNALNKNFDSQVPCHRVVRSDGMLGGFGGGLKMKKALLEMEGVAFDRSGRVQKAHLWP